MSSTDLMQTQLGFIGAGRMGSAMVRRLRLAKYEVTVWNRTLTRADDLRPTGAVVAADLSDAAKLPIAFTSLASSGDLEDVIVKILALEHRPNIVIDTSTVSVESSQRVRLACHDHGVQFLSAPVSGNPAAVEAGSSAFICSGDEDAFAVAKQALLAITPNVSYLGPGDEARVVKICHNMLLGIITQGLAEVLTLCAKHGVTADVVMQFLNNSVLGSTFTRYKTPAILAHDLTPTFTSTLLLKDLDLGLNEGTQTATPLPVTALVRTEVLSAIAQGMGDLDFLCLIAVAAHAAGLTFTATKPISNHS